MYPGAPPTVPKLDDALQRIVWNGPKSRSGFVGSEANRRSGPSYGCRVRTPLLAGALRPSRVVSLS
jgi:hypothetical protein